MDASLASDKNAQVAKALRLPSDPASVLRKRESLKRELRAQADLLPTRIAILGGSTTAELKSTLELFLLANGIRPSFYESGYNRYYEDVMFGNKNLWEFKPDIVLIHTNWRNVSQFPELMESESDVEQRVRNEMVRFESLWSRIHAELGSLIIQNNFDLPGIRPLGNLEASEPFGRMNFLLRLNAEFARYARSHQRFLINDILFLSSQVGLAQWSTDTYWYNFHMAVTPIATVALANNVAGMIRSIYGRSKKCLVLDLDNTLWGGVIGDDGVANLILGRDHPVGEAFLDFQRYVKDLRRRGVILAVCSKNEPETAKEGFSHPDSVLKLEDFTVFKANWNNKPDNIREIAAELNISLNSIVFVDDNPAERALVADQLPEVAVPEIGSHASRFAKVLEDERFFDTIKVVQDDLSRAAYYNDNAQRAASQSEFQDYGEFLASLEMTAEIGPFEPVYLERIAQLVNKTNQFNLTTKRYAPAELDAIAQDQNFITLYGRLADRFGDNGLVSVVLGHTDGDALELELWLMSCRVFNRELELAMFDSLVEQCQARGVGRIRGVYIPSKKNAMVAGFYGTLGFTRLQGSDSTRQIWEFQVPRIFSARTRFIRRTTKASRTVVAV